MNRDGLVLSGGGSRAAYQVGVMKALFELAPEYRPGILSGFSAGAINTGYLAMHADEPAFGIDKMEKLWSELHTENVFRTDFLNLILNGLRLIWDLSFGGIHQHTSVRALLDTRPLDSLLSREISSEKISANLKESCFDSVSVSATDYADGESVSFFQCRHRIEGFQRKRRRAEIAKISYQHIMASAALPLLFPSVQVGERHFGDGCLRNIAPLSTAIHLGAEALMVIGVRRQVEESDSLKLDRKPGLGRVLSVVMNALLLDTTDVDVERLQRTNELVDLAGAERAARLGFRKIDYLWFTPSQDIGKLAKDYSQDLPFSLRYLLRGTGSRAEFSEIASYLLFEPAFLKKLIEIGYEDVHRDKQRLFDFLERTHSAKPN